MLGDYGGTEQHCNSASHGISQERNLFSQERRNKQTKKQKPLSTHQSASLFIVRPVRLEISPACCCMLSIIVPQEHASPSFEKVRELNVELHRWDLSQLEYFPWGWYPHFSWYCLQLCRCFILYCENTWTVGSWEVFDLCFVMLLLL